MQVDHDHPLLAAAGFGALAGMRSLAAPALLAHQLAHDRPCSVAQAGVRAVRLLEFLALGEFAADKLPWTPARVRAFPLAGRALSGAATGAVVGAVAGGNAPGGADVGVADEARDEARKKTRVCRVVHGGQPLRILRSASVGGASAIATAFATYHLRRLYGRYLHLGNAAAGVAEDGIALLIGWAAARNLCRPP